MVERVFLFLFLILGWTAGLSGQVLSVDSVEVSIVIPEHQKKEILFNSDSLRGEEQFSLLKYLRKKDSLLAEKNSYSSGRIKITTDNYFNQLIREQTLREWDRRRLFFETITQRGFNPWRFSLWWEHDRTYKPFALTLKYKKRDSEPFFDDVSVNLRNPIKEYHHFLKHPLGADTLITELAQPPVEHLMNEILYQHPDMTDELWENIPEPPGFSFGEGYIKNRSANESMERLLLWETPETNRKLEKKDAIQRQWTYGGTENIQVSQAFQENWVKGGENSVSLLSDLRLQARYKKNNVEWESYVIHKLGILNTEGNTSRFNDDLIELSSKYGLSAGNKWFYSGLINFKTQFFDGYESRDVEKENPVSGFLAPAYLTLAIGMDYKEKNFTLMLLPVTSKMTLVTDTVKFDQTRYKIAEDRKADNMGGASLVNSFSWSLARDFNLESKMDFFYEYMRNDNQIQAEWELILDMQINVFLSTRIATYLRYYSNESEYVQFRENLSISFNYRF
ncbi:DUF3078 domain-containing protein [Marinilabilia sp.]|uniref:DUF3078 domain-containing protein n=1 Tax=Marinilabilia sp. TaxID=2021252 RepID=UPI0025C0F17B|nr:DUF3078 domain-containing protein [Marinilabilia sp.]